jgi:hypothetical protein
MNKEPNPIAQMPAGKARHFAGVAGFGKRLFDGEFMYGMVAGIQVAKQYFFLASRLATHA